MAPASSSTRTRNGRSPRIEPIEELTAPASAVPARTAFSYLRVSSGKQTEDGRTGLDRQADQFLPFCDRHGLIPCVDPVQDRGISAFRGRHRSRGALAAFLDAARNGRIPAGSVLVVEDLDRFSREAPSHAEQTLLDVFDLGLALGIVRDDVVVDRARYDSDIGVRLQLLVRRDAAHDYSRKLSERVAVVHERMRARARQGEIVSPHLRPQWLDWDAAAARFVFNDRASTYRRMIELCLQGIGGRRAAQILNQEGHVNADGQSWGETSIAKVWRDRRLIGERIHGPEGGEAETVAGYFPALITAEDFNRVQELVAHRRGERGRIGRGDKRHNLFQGVVVCLCGSPMHLLVTTRKVKRSYAYLQCRAKGRGLSCRSLNVKYDEEDVLKMMLRQEWRRYFDRPDDTRQRREIERQVREQEGAVSQLQQHRQNAEGQLRALLTGGTLDADTAALLGRLATDARRDAEAAEATLRGLQERLRQASLQPDGPAMQKAIQERIEAFLATDRLDTAERIKFNAWLNTLGATFCLYRDQRGRCYLDTSLQELRAWGGDDGTVEAMRTDLMRRAWG